jgi:hypothetical protein
MISIYTEHGFVIVQMPLYMYKVIITYPSIAQLEERETVIGYCYLEVTGSTPVRGTSFFNLNPCLRADVIFN